ncbi:MAG: hypothetical protein KBG84_00700 [Planctomycetes bacterium]|nr:hypothetical protein [Planctomycetota bacterium]
MNSRVLIIGLVTAALGLGFGFMAGYSWRHEPQRAARANDSLDLPEPTRKNNEALKTPNSLPLGQPEKPQPAETNPAKPEVEKPSLRQAIAALGDVSPKGSGVLTGAVVDELGSGVAGCEISVQIESAFRTLKVPQRADFADEDSYVEAMLIYQYKLLKMREMPKALTDAAGRFTISGLPGEGGTVFCRSVEHVHADGGHTAQQQFKMGDSVVFSVFRAASIKVRVESARMTENRTAVITLTAMENGKSCWRAVKPNMEIILYAVAGKYSIQAKADGNDLRSPSVNIEVGADSAKQLIVLSLDGENSLAGEVRFAGARPLYVAVRGSAVEGSFTDEELLRQGGRSSSVFDIEFDKKKSSFFWKNPSPGEYVIGVFGPGKMLASKRVTLGGTNARLDFEIPAPAFELSVRVKIAAPEKYSLENLGLNVVNLANSQSVAIEVWLEGPATYLINLKPRERETGKFENARLTAVTHELGVMTAEFRPGADAEVTLVFGPPAEYTLNLTGTPPDGWLSLNVFRSGEKQAISGNSFVISKGKRAHAGDPKLQPGAYRFEIASQNGGPESFVLASVEVTLAAGLQTVTLDIPKLSMIKVDASAIKQRSWLSLRQESSGRKIRIDFDKDGIAVISVLPPGEYAITRMATRRGRDGVSNDEEVVKAFRLPTAETVILAD